MMRRTLVSLAVLLALVAPSAARADQGDDATADAEAAEDGEPTALVMRRWYGWEPLIFDGAAIGVGAIATATRSQGLGSAAMATYLFASPSIHIAHRHTGKMLASFGLRAGLPILGMLAGYAIASRPVHPGDAVDLSGASAAMTGVVLGAFAAGAFDDAVVSNEDVYADRPVIVRPSARVVNGGAILGVSGVF